MSHVMTTAIQEGRKWAEELISRGGHSVELTKGGAIVKWRRSNGDSSYYHCVVFEGRNIWLSGDFPNMVMDCHAWAIDWAQDGSLETFSEDYWASKVVLGGNGVDLHARLFLVFLAAKEAENASAVRS